ncbi:type II secretion system protein [Aeromonas simiae]|uniref:type II secretion system protein n=1 Tax=Aeromonas simiae TaxID=218936 RepID=UPI00266C0553|nr:type II secretion system protein [Aeromonas simiae]MDO2947630.1 type II secretion system GspH family protein [Aeromonas simiae]MDO2953034.1 type II secretion system GspH family protein [Aeromonas simiae]MDO2954845.1 type II secretion system GspH family protein [Aeromonas simiae]
MKGQGATHSSQAGFTLNEFLFVLLIIMVLISIGGPRLYSAKQAAQEAQVRQIANSFATALMLVRSKWELEGRNAQFGKNSVLYDNLRLYLTTPESPRTGIQAGNLVDVAGEREVNVAPHAITADSCQKMWHALLEHPPLISASLAELNQAGNNAQFFVIAQRRGLDSACHYYPVGGLSKLAGQYQDPHESTDAIVSFSYRPASGQVITHVK